MYIQSYVSRYKTILAIAVLALLFELVFPHHAVHAQIIGDEINESDLTYVAAADTMVADPEHEPYKYGEPYTEEYTDPVIYHRPVYSDEEPQRVMMVTTTAYSSSVDETDSTPFITANGSYVYWGVVASNNLSFKTRVRFPDQFGNQVFVVEDRMNARYNNVDIVDIWHPSKAEAKQYGAKVTKMEILD